MAQRNPMNERYLGDGPQGKTRKSAAKLKPKTEAASSVHIDKKPTTKQERKAASKKRDAQIAAKEAERKRKAEERELKARIANGEVIEKPKKAGPASSLKKFFAPSPSSSTAKNAPAKPAASSKGPNTPEYRRLKAIYWTLMGVGIVSIIISFLVNFSFPNLFDGMGMMIPMGVAYAAVIAAIILDYTKIRKMQKAHRGEIGSGKGSPKQLKHEQRKREAAQLLEESKKAQKELKRANSKLPFKRKSAETPDASETSEDYDASDILDDSDDALSTFTQTTSEEKGE